MGPAVLRPVLLSAALAMVLNACGEAADRSGSAAPGGKADPTCLRVAGAARWEGVARASSATATLDEHDDYFTPTCIEVPWKTPVTLVVTNFGHMPHTVTIRRTSVDTDVDSGQTAFVRVPATTVPLRIVCTFHLAERMFAAVIPVRGAP